MTTDRMPERKSVEALIESAFMAGMRVGAGFPEMRAIPANHARAALQQFRDRWIGRPETPSRRPAETTRNLLLLVRDDFPGAVPSVEQIAAWPSRISEEVREWAGAVHLHASDNDDVVVPPIPAVLRQWPITRDVELPLGTRLGHAGGHYG